MVCSALELARSSFYAAKQSKKVNDELDNNVWKKIVKLWGKFPGIGYRKISAF
jgi:hypothetical protein